MPKKTATRKILELLRKEEPLGTNQIAEKLNMSLATVKSTMSMARQFGAVQYYRGIRGAYQLTNHGILLLENKTK